MEGWGLEEGGLGVGDWEGGQVVEVGPGVGSWGMEVGGLAVGDLAAMEVDQAEVGWVGELVGREAEDLEKAREEVDLEGEGWVGVAVD